MRKLIIHACARLKYKICSKFKSNANSNENESENATGEDTYAGALRAPAPPLAFLLSFLFEFTFDLNCKKRRIAMTSPKCRRNVAQFVTFFLHVGEELIWQAGTAHWASWSWLREQPLPPKCCTDYEAVVDGFCDC